MTRPIWTTGMLLVAVGAMGVLAALLVIHRTSGDRASHFTPSRDLSEAVADPDMFFSPQLHAAND